MRGKFLGRCLLMAWVMLTLVACSSTNFFSLSGRSTSIVSPQPFSHDGGWYTFTAWSPDGHWLAAPVYNDADRVRLYAPDGQIIGNWRSDCGVDVVMQTISWLSDGRMSCFYSGTDSTSSVWIATLDQSGQESSHTEIPLPLSSDGFIFSFQWNPRHNWLAIVAGKNESQAWLHIFDLAGHQLLPPISDSGAGMVLWSPDGKLLAMVEKEDILLLNFQQTQEGKLLVQSEKKLVVQTPPEDTIAWSPSGHWLVCRHETYEGEDYLFLLATDGSGKQVQLTSSSRDGQLFNPSWSPDGKRLIMTHVGDWSLFSLDMSSFFQQKKLVP